MTYVEQAWSNNPADLTPLSEERLRHIEEGVGNATDLALSAVATAETLGRVQAGGVLLPMRPAINFIGPGATVTDSPLTTVVDFSGNRVEDDGSPVALDAVAFNFGAGLLAYSDGFNRVTVVASGGGGGGSAAVGTSLPAFFHTGPLAVLDGDGWRFYNDTLVSWQITSVRAGVRVSPTGAAIRVDVNVGGTSIFYADQTARPAVAIGARTSGKVAAPNTAIVAPGNYVTVDIDQVGSTVAGESLQVQIQVA